MSGSSHQIPVGAITSTPDPPNTSFAWILLRDLSMVSKGEMVVIRDAKRPDLGFIGQVIDKVNRTNAINSEIERGRLIQEGRTAEGLVQGALSRPEFFTAMAKVKLMYQFQGNGSMQSVSETPADSSLVYRADQSTIADALALLNPRAASAVCLGTLYSDRSVEICLDANRLVGGHVAIFGQTWSGKSYAAGVLMEELAFKEVPVVVFDHMGEYLQLDRTPDGKPSGIKVKVLDVSKNDITVDPEYLIEEPRILSALGMSDPQINLLIDAYNYVSSSQGLKGVEAIARILGAVPKPAREGSKRQSFANDGEPVLYSVGREMGYHESTIDALRWRLSSLLRKGVLGDGFDAAKLISRGLVTVIDLSGVDEASVRTLVVASVLSTISRARKLGLIPPTVVVLEEAHNYVSADETPSSVLIRDLVRGARHIGVGVVLVSQRPAGIHRDAVNVVNTHIIFRLKGTDLEYVRQFAPLTREELDDIQLLPEGVAYITGPIIRGSQAIKVRIRERRTVHGGASVEFIKQRSSS